MVVEDGLLLYFDKCGYELIILEEILESILKFYLYEFELFELDNEVDGSWEFSFMGFFNSYESLKLRVVFY